MKAHTKNGRKRPIKVLYYDNPNAMPHDYASQGHCVTEAGVLKGAMIRLFMRERALARVYKEGICIMTVRLRKDGLPEVRFGPHVLGVVRVDGTINYGAA